SADFTPQRKRLKVRLLALLVAEYGNYAGGAGGGGYGGYAGYSQTAPAAVPAAAPAATPGGYSAGSGYDQSGGYGQQPSSWGQQSYGGYGASGDQSGGYSQQGSSLHSQAPAPRVTLPMISHPMVQANPSSSRSPATSRATRPNPRATTRAGRPQEGEAATQATVSRRLLPGEGVVATGASRLVAGATEDNNLAEEAAMEAVVVEAM
ncbi:unnamed protein product, partial [Timema podura]|nr:unnamed protein product [Timema podura]